MKKTVTLISNVLLFMALFVLIVVGLLPSQIGFSFHSIISGSMEPALKTGSVIGLKAANAADIVVDDIICFETDDKSAPVCHRVVEEVLKDGVVYFRTKGDAVEERDDWLVRPENILGKVVFHLPGMGYFSAFLKTLPGFIVFIALPALVIMLIELKDYMVPKRARVRRAEERRKTFLTPANSFLQVGLVLIVLVWLTVTGTTQKRQLDTYTKVENNPPTYARVIKNEGRLPLIICLFSEYSSLSFSEDYFWLSPGEEKRVEMHSDRPDAMIVTRGFLPTLPASYIYELFTWSVPLSSFAAAFIPIFPILALGWVLLGGFYSSRSDHRERARQMKGRLI